MSTTIKTTSEKLIKNYLKVNHLTKASNESYAAAA